MTYQEALNCIGLVISNIRGMRNGKTQLANCFLKLQELIDEHNKLEKALDKACEHLSYITYYDVAIKKEVSTKEEWKEYLLGEEE